MNPDAQQLLINHMYKSETEAAGIQSILSSSRFISEVTTSPLLLTLFAITYKARQCQPDSLSEFYNLIFQTMLYRHDRNKFGFVRERKSGLSDFNMQKLFDSISFLSLQDNKTSFDINQFQCYAGSGIRFGGFPDNIENDLIDDIVNITALIIKDGYDEYFFTHKSIQEYFAAMFISRLEEEQKERFYQRAVCDFLEFQRWQNTLNFLENVDERNYKKYFLIPFKKNALCLDRSGVIKIDYSSFLKLIGSDSAVFIDEEGVVREAYWGDTFSSILFSAYSDFAKARVLKYFSKIKKELADYLAYCSVEEYKMLDLGDGSYVIKIDKFIKDNNEQRKISQYLSTEFELSSFRNEVLSMEENLNKSDVYRDSMLTF